jgi:UDP-glucose 4-epimerase
MSKKSKGKVLVIGGSGFMGSHTADDLTRRGYQVSILDRVKSPWIQENQEMIIGDFQNIETLLSAMKDVTYVYHFAGIADIGEAKANPHKTIEANVLGVTKVVEAAVQCGVERIIYASTMYVYSKHGSFYRASKQAGEIIIEAYCDENKLDYTFLRYGSLYGPRSQEWNGIRRFATQIIKHGKLDYKGNGNEIREYIHVHDAAKLSVDVLDEKHSNCAITITGHQLFRVSDVLSILFEIAGKEEIINYCSENKKMDHYGNTPYRYTPKQAKKIVPTEFVDLGQGLLDVIEEVYHENER